MVVLRFFLINWTSWRVVGGGKTQLGALSHCYATRKNKPHATIAFVLCGGSGAIRIFARSR